MNDCSRHEMFLALNRAAFVDELPPPTYTPLSTVPLDLLRDGLTLQSRRALELVRDLGLEVPDAKH